MEEETKNTPEVETEDVSEVKIKKKPGNAVKTFFMTTTNGMAIGLFGTLIIGVIINLFSRIPGLAVVGTWAGAVQALMGAGIGLGVALSLKKTGIQAVAIMVAGMVGNYAFHWLPGDTQFTATMISDPLSCYVGALAGLGDISLLKDRKTPVDLLLIPLLGITASMLYSLLMAEWIHYVTVGISYVIKVSFDVVPFLMCIIISVLVGMALTAPISSVAICVAIRMGSVPLAAAAALIGCCTQMVGIAVESARDNKWGSVLAIGIGTSMLQFKNIIRKPLIWLPTIIVSAVLGPLAMLFPLDGVKALVESGSTETVTLLSAGAGMGTSGLVGPLNFLSAIGYDSWQLWLLIILVCVIGCGALVFLVDLLFRKLGWIKEGDFSLKNEM